MLWPWGTKGTSPAVPRDAAPRLRRVCPRQWRGTLWGAVASWLGAAALPVSASLEHRVCTGKAQHPSGSDGPCASSVCAQSLLPLGTKVSAHSGLHTGGVHVYVCTCAQIQVCVCTLMCNSS